MRMKATSALALLAPLAFGLGTALPALAQTSAQEFRGLGCKIARPAPDAGAALITFDTRKTCPGNSPDATVAIECRGTFNNWTGGTVTHKGFPCEIKGDQCGIAADLDATEASLTINTNGSALLKCSFKVPKGTGS